MVSVIIPTYNASSYLDAQLCMLRRQKLPEFEILIIDSSSSDRTLEIAKAHAVRTLCIPKKDFGHGRTRTLGAKHCLGEILVFLTQDALPVDESSLPRLVAAFDGDRRVGAAFGRQFAYENATPFARHLRLFNYPDTSYTRSFSDRTTWGIKAAFCSNSYAAYRRTALESVKWFEEHLILGEDTHTCAKLLKSGFLLRYVSESAVYHSHNYTLSQEFKRYFDLGAFFKTEKWILEEFGRLEGEGFRFLRSELTFLIQGALYHYIPLSLCRTFAKWLGYRLGHVIDRLPADITRRLSMHAHKAEA